MHVTAFALVAVVLLGAACGETARKNPEPTAAATPTEPPPKVPGVSSAPPPAWIETRGGDRWLAFFDYCWGTTCVDSRPVEQRRDVPRIKVVRAEVVRFHLRFRPTELTLRVRSKSYPLKLGRVASWRVRGTSGFVNLTARAAPGRAEYVTYLRIR